MAHDLAARLRELFLNGKWVAHTNLKEQITGTSREEAVQRVANLNTIAQLTFHISYYLKGLINVFEGGTLEIKDKFSFDMPEITSEDDWNDLVNEFIRSSENFIYHIEKMDDAFLHQPFIKKEYGSYLRNIEAQIEHGYYHLGQIVLIKKILLQKNKESLPYSAC